MKSTTTSRFSKARYLVAALLMALGLGAIALVLSARAGGRALADDPPALLPISPPKFLSLFPAAAPDTAQYDVSLSILDFDPGAATREQSRPGQLFATVVEGEITVREGTVETVYVKGEKFTEDHDIVGSVSNMSNTTARVLVTVLSSPGAPAEVDRPNSPRPALLPKVAFAGTTTVDAIQGPLRLSQGIFDFVPGAGSGAHSHAGPGIVIVMSGEMTQRIPGDEVKQKVGDVFAEVPGRPVDHRNFGTETATVATSYLIPVGAPPAVPAMLPGSPPLLTPAPAPPSPTAIPPP